LPYWPAAVVLFASLAECGFSRASRVEGSAPPNMLEAVVVLMEVMVEDKVLSS
jgi:hypothetical protein